MPPGNLSDRMSIEISILEFAVHRKNCSMWLWIFASHTVTWCFMEWYLCLMQHRCVPLKRPAKIYSCDFFMKSFLHPGSLKVTNYDRRRFSLFLLIMSSYSKSVVAGSNISMTISFNNPLEIITKHKKCLCNKVKQSATHWWLPMLLGKK